MKKFFQEFKTFITKGNVMDLAVAVIVGNSFTKIVNSLVKDILTPLITWALGKSSLEDFSIVLRSSVDSVTGETVLLTWNYGAFLQSIIDFLIIAFFVFSVVKVFNVLRKATENVGQKVLALSKRELKKLKKQAKQEGVSVDELASQKLEEKAEGEVVAPETESTQVVKEPTEIELLQKIVSLLEKQDLKNQENAEIKNIDK